MRFILYLFHQLKLITEPDQLLPPFHKVKGFVIVSLAVPDPFPGEVKGDSGNYNKVDIEWIVKFARFRGFRNPESAFSQLLQVDNRAKLNACAGDSGIKYRFCRKSRRCKNRSGIHLVVDRRV